jgi:N utilization substance protein B
MGTRHRGRELAFQILFQMDLGRDSIGYALQYFLDLKAAHKEAAAFAEELARGASEHLKEIDALITQQSKNWDFKRLNSVDRALMRLGVFELIHRADIPAEVTLNECIELAKGYGSEESPAFVNGILDQIRKEHAPAKGLGQSQPKRAKKRRTGGAKTALAQPLAKP